MTSQKEKKNVLRELGVLVFSRYVMLKRVRRKDVFLHVFFHR